MAFFIYYDGVKTKVSKLQKNFHPYNLLRSTKFLHDNLRLELLQDEAVDEISFAGHWQISNPRF
jgi:hypothetical protein